MQLLAGVSRLLPASLAQPAVDAHALGNISVPRIDPRRGLIEFLSKRFSHDNTRPRASPRPCVFPTMRKECRLPVSIPEVRPMHAHNAVKFACLRCKGETPDASDVPVRSLAFSLYRCLGITFNYIFMLFLKNFIGRRYSAGLSGADGVQHARKTC